MIPGGTVAMVSSVGIGAGAITTASPNVNGILGGYALISGDGRGATTFTDTGHTLIVGTNYATAFFTNGVNNIINFTGYTNYNFGSTLNGRLFRAA